MHYDHESPEPRRTGHLWVDFVIAGSALTVSVISLFVAIGHGHTMEEMAQANARLVEANSWPFVASILSRDDNSVAIGIRNAGVGPAKVHWVEVKYGGAAQADVPHLLAKCCGYRLPTPGAASRLSYENSVAADQVLRAGDETRMIILRRRGVEAPVFEALERNLLGISFRVCYCSVFDECFVGDGGHLNVQKVADCTGPATNFAL